MPSRVLPGLGLSGFWALGEDGWKDGMDGNLRVLAALVQPRVISVLTADPGSPADGDIYYFGAGHPTHAHQLAIRDAGNWVYIPAFAGMEFWNVADKTKYRFDGTDLVVVPNIVLMASQAEYDALAVKDPNTVYDIPEA